MPRRLATAKPTESSTVKMAAGLTMIAPALPIDPAPAPVDPPMTIVPALSVMAPTKEPLATPRVSVPAPSLVSEETAPKAVVSRVILPAPTKVRFWAPVIPPRMVSVEPASDPILEAEASVISPFAMLEPEYDSSAPALLIPTLLSVSCSKMETLLASCRAAPTLLATVVAAEERPRAPLFVMRSAPLLMVAVPPQTSLLAASTSVP